MKPKKRLGQNFLKDRNILIKEVRLAGVHGKRVVEIGAGDGRLTAEIAVAKPEILYAVEKDRELADALRGRFGDEKRVVVVEGDFLEEELPEFDVAIGNIPYYISSAIIFRLAEFKFERAVLIVQKEFAERMVAKPNESNYGRLSVTSQLAFDVKLVQKVPRHLFYPQPKVDSAMILLKPTGRKLAEFEEDVIRALFQHRNKTVANALLHSKKFGKERIGALGDYAKRRVRTLSKEECLEIAAILKTR
ncbi:ribosomal RNA small subunit methyltransferase A [Candidatus Micrarchaeota archaeon]|nr:ribosomal RNA small subunit methyltransferase A [Candidatus Micrarchaeota archaeon]